MICEMGFLDSYRLTSFKDIYSVGKGHFQCLFTNPTMSHIVEKMMIIKLFPNVFDKHMNDSLEVVFTKENIKEVFISFKKSKSTESYGLAIEFYICFFDFLMDELFKGCEGILCYRESSQENKFYMYCTNS